jgi:citrate lyase beta subunit
MNTSLGQTDLDLIAGIIRDTNTSLPERPGLNTFKRQPIHTVYGGAHLFSADVVRKFSEQSLKSLRENAPTAVSFARAVQLGGDVDFGKKIYQRVLDKLRCEPVEDYRIDFEDGFGLRSDQEEDEHAVRAAGELAKAMAAGSVPPFIGVRIKPLTLQYSGRAIRTLDLFLTRLFEQNGKKLPDNFVVTLPKVDSEKQVIALVKILEILETRFLLSPGILKLEVMVETPRMFAGNNSLLSSLPDLSRGRCFAAHFGPYDFTASLNITSSHQRLDHPACDIARSLIQISLAGTNVFLSDGPTNILPVGPYRAVKGKPLTPRQRLTNRERVHNAWKLSFRNISRALEQGYYQGWDLHPAQLPVRYAATYVFFLAELESTTQRLKTFLDGITRVSLRQSVFDDAATGRGLFNFFRRGFICGALTTRDVKAAGLAVEEFSRM